MRKIVYQQHGDKQIELSKTYVNLSYLRENCNRKTWFLLNLRKLIHFVCKTQGKENFTSTSLTSIALI